MKAIDMLHIRKQLEEQGIPDEIIRDVIRARIAVAAEAIAQQDKRRKDALAIRRAKAAVAKHDAKRKPCPQQRADAVAIETDVAPVIKRGLIMVGEW